MLQERREFDPYAMSSKLRTRFRGEKKARVESEGRAGAVRDKYGLGERVRVEDLRTPRDVAVKTEEDREWSEAKRERERREEISRGKRRREVDQISWNEKESNFAIEEHASKRSTHQSSSKSRAFATSTFRPIKSLPTSIKKKVNQPSQALQALATKIKLATALKSDPFTTSIRSSAKRKLEER